MKVIIAGGRDITDYNEVKNAILSSGFTISEVVSGKARGVDTLGERWAVENNIPIKEFPADWNRFGNRAGPLRNEQMGDYAHALIAVWDGKSKGTHHMIEYSKRKGLCVFIYIVKDSRAEYHNNKLPWDLFNP